MPRSCRREHLGLAGPAQHLVDVVLVRDLGGDHVARVFLEAHVVVLHEREQRLVGLERLALVLQRLAQDVADVVPVRFEKRPDRERRMAAEPGDELAGEARVVETLGGLRAQPRDDRDPVVAIDHQRVMGVANHPGEFELHDPVERLEHG